MRALFAILSLSILAVPPAHLAEEAPPAARPAEMIGEITVLPSGGSASYSLGRVVGPAVNLTETEKGTWKGNIRSYDGILKVTEKRISGVAFNLVLDQDGDEWTAQGVWEGKRVRIAATPDSLTVRIESKFYEMKRVAPDLFATVPAGPGLRVKGDAAARFPSYPQFVLAILGTL